MYAETLLYYKRETKATAPEHSQDVAKQLLLWQQPVTIVTPNQYLGRQMLWIVAAWNSDSHEDFISVYLEKYTLYLKKCYVYASWYLLIKITYTTPRIPFFKYKLIDLEKL